MADPDGIVGPKGMEASTVKILMVAFGKIMKEPRQVATLEQLPLEPLTLEPWFLGSEGYRQWAIAQFEKEKALIHRLGLFAD